ncbi:tight adherence protein B [Nakamurella sp. UYEF19]|uniref:type II secretion system F family protein n=1 Tax=Nakamurella sp. UYEF19 TaxID=1756392 RepID=UPI003393DCE2
MVTCLLAAVALLCWPGSSRLRPSFAASGIPGTVFGSGPGSESGSGPGMRGGQPDHDRRRGTSVAAPGISAAAVISWWAAGPMVAASAALFLTTVAMLVRSESGRRHRRRDLVDMLAGCRTLGREIRAGAAPMAAIRASAQEQHGRSARMLADLAVAVSVDRGRAPAASNGLQAVVDGRRGRSDRIAEITDRLATAWLLSARYGVPLAVLVDTVSDDLDERLSATSQREAQVSGPRVSGYVLAAMPALGVVLGVGMGADPLHVLFFTGAGQLMLMTGTALTCAGLAWTARIVRG